MLSMVTFVPLFVQGVLGKTAVEAGSAITPMVVGWPISIELSPIHVIPPRRPTSGTIDSEYSMTRRPPNLARASHVAS